MCFDHFMLWATCQEGSAELAAAASCGFFFPVGFPCGAGGTWICKASRTWMCKRCKHMLRLSLGT